MKLAECFKLYTAESEVPSYRCEHCRKTGHCKQHVSLYRCPQVLVLQLKRFAVTGNKREKLITDVSIPEWLRVGAYAHHLEFKGQYQLYAVSHHIGSLSFGRVVADCLDSAEWFSFDDSRASKAQLRASSATAYVLFYRRLSEANS